MDRISKLARRIRWRACPDCRGGKRGSGSRPGGCGRCETGGVVRRFGDRRGS